MGRSIVTSPWGRRWIRVVAAVPQPLKRPGKVGFYRGAEAPRNPKASSLGGFSLHFSKTFAVRVPSCRWDRGWIRVVAAVPQPLKRPGKVGFYRGAEAPRYPKASSLG